MTRRIEDLLSRGLSEASTDRPRSSSARREDPETFGRRVATELFEEYVKGRQKKTHPK